MPASRGGRFQEPTAVRVRLLAGPERIAVAGDLPAISRHRHAAPAIVVGVDGPLTFVAGRAQTSRAALIAPGFTHAVETKGGRLAMFVLPPHAVAADNLTAPLLDLGASSRWVELGSALVAGEMDDLSMVDLYLGRERIRPRPVDDRLRVALAALSRELDRNLSIDELAGAARLSASRLMAVARDQLGSSLRHYRSWLRSFRVARDYAAGRSLTEAALDAGFASSAHLSAATREHFGIRPSDVLSPNNRSGIRLL